MSRPVLALLSLVATVGLTASVAAAGPNQGGVLWVHDTGVEFSTDLTLPPASAPPADCAGVDNQMPLWDGATPPTVTSRFWKVYAAFPPTSSPRLKAVGWEIEFPENTSSATSYVYVASGVAPDEDGPGTDFFIGDAGFPTASAGTIGQAFPTGPRLTTVTTLFIFWGWAFNDGSAPPIWRVVQHSVAANRFFSDDANPQELDAIAGYGSLGFGTPGTTPCPTTSDPDAACCALAGTCTITKQAACAAPSVWFGTLYSCTPNPCPVLTGACCYADGTCQVSTQQQCVDDGGVYQGNFASCTPNPCPVPAACCLPSGSCLVRTQSACGALFPPGIWHAEWFSCSPNLCLLPATGACCEVAGACTVTTQGACTSPSIWHGDWVSCAPNPCLQPDGTPEVTNVVGARRPGTAIVDVTYDLSDSDSDSVTVTLRMSEDGGVSFPIECRTVTGDVGGGVLSGTGRHIAWDAGADYPDHAAATYAPRVCADDTQGPPGMVWVPPGNVRLGQTAIAEPVNDVYVEGFYIDRYEVSNAEYKVFIDAGGYTTQAYWNTVGWAWRMANGITLPEGWNSNTYHGGGIAGNEQFPVNGVSWFEADAYCRWAGGRLPTEAEWEKAAKGGCEIHGDSGQCDAADTSPYPWGEGIAGPQANYQQSGDPYDSNGYTTPVGYYDGTSRGGYQTIDSPSPYGLYDVVGNVLEWCSTRYAAYPHDPSDGRETPPVSDSECCRVLRGGSCVTYDNFLRSATRGSTYPYYRYNEAGFRCVRTGS